MKHYVILATGLCLGIGGLLINSTTTYGLVDSYGWVSVQRWDTQNQYVSHDTAAKVEKDGTLPRTVTVSKPQGNNRLRIRQEITLFKDTTISTCPSQPIIEREYNDFDSLTQDELLCYSCTNKPTTTVDDYNDVPCTERNGDNTQCLSPLETSYDNCYWRYNGTSTGACMEGRLWVGTHDVYHRTCTPKYSGTTGYIIRNGSPGTLYTEANFPNEWNKIRSCNPGSTTPTQLVLWDTKDKSYFWDEISPTCVRQAAPSFSYWNGDFYDTPYILSELNSGAGADSTLVYQCPSASCGTLSGNTYTGSWTRFDIIGRWSCVDDEDGSGCKTTDPIISPNLHHFQSSHIPDLSYLTDKTDNNPDNDGKDDTTKSCDSYVRKPTDIQRSCYYVIDQAKVQEVMSSGSLATSLTNLQTYSGALYTTLSNIKDGTIPSPGDSNFGRAISNLREASRFLFCPGGKDFNITGAIGDNSCLHKLYYINESTCKYTPIYGAATFPILIDKILPTINISTTVDSTTKTVLNQEDDSSETPHFTAGTGVVVVTMEDRSRSEYLPNEAYSHQLSFSGISGIRSYYIEVKRTKNFKGELLDADGNISPSGTGYILYLTGNTLDDEYNPDGTVGLNHVIIFSGGVHENVFRMAGTYDIKVIVRDGAGNRNPTTATFVVDPTDPPVFSCITDPCSCLSRPPICTPSLCDAKNGPFPGCCVIYPSNPQCRSIKIETTPGTSSLTKLREKSASPYYASGSEIDSADIIYTISGTTSGSVPITGLTPIPFANAFDRSLYRIHIADTDGNPVYNWPIIGLTLSTTGIYLDEVNRTGTTALWIDAGQGYKNTPQTIQTDENGNIFFRILSYTPGQYTEQLSFSYFNPWINSSNNYAREATGSLQTVTGFPRIDLAQTGQFYHILTGAIDLYTNDRIDLGTENDIRLEFFTTTTTTDTTLTGFTVSNFLDSLKSLNETNFEVTNTGSTYSTGINLNSLGYPTPNNPSGATGTFIPEQVGGLFGDILEIRTWPYLTLTFGDSSRGGPQTAIYWASTAIGNYLSGITYAGGGVNRIYIEGTKRATGKEGYVDATASIGSTNSADVRNAVHKNVAILLRNRAPSSDTTKIVNRVKYVTGDQTGSTVFADFGSWDTLVIKDGNLTIDANFNSGPNLNSISHKGIIVLSEDGTKGNIYIKPNVQFIGATLFADESIYSVNDMGAVYTNSDSARTSDLNKQLVFYGGIFSKNTVGGAVRADNDGEYTLPWKGKTRNLDEAVKYDLAFLRMDKIDVLSSLNRGHNEYFVVILHDARNLSKPLPGFATTVR